MSTSKLFVVSRAVVIQIDQSGRYVATNSIAREPFVLQPVHLEVLRGFGRPVTRAEAQERATSLPRAEFESTVEELIRANVVTESRSNQQDASGYHAAAGEFASPMAHHEMLRDVVRTMTYRSAIFGSVAGKVVLDIGCGSGILSIFAAQAGAKKVYAIEESEIFSLARAMFAANGVEDKISLYVGNSFDVQLPEKVDIIVHELFAGNALNENVVSIITDARRRFLAPGGKIMPGRIEVCCIGVESPFVPTASRRTMLEASEFPSLYGVNFDPYQAMLASMTFSDLPNNCGFARIDPHNALFEQPILTDECILLDVDLYGDSDAQSVGETKATLRVREPGRLGGVVNFFRVHLDAGLTLSTSPFRAKTHWGWGVKDLSRIVPVEPGQVVGLSCRLRSVSGRQVVTVDLL